MILCVSCGISWLTLLLTTGQIFHGPLITAHVPSWVNTLQRRNYTIHNTAEGKLLNIQSVRGGGYTGELWWRKVD